MGVMNNLTDKLTEKITKKETIRLTFEQIAKIVKDEFIDGANDEFLDKVLKTAKGGSFITEKRLESANGRYLLFVGRTQDGVALFGRRKQVWVEDKEANKFYQIDKKRSWKKFYKAVSAYINMEKVNRNR